MRALGLSAYYHDSAAALVDGGRVVAAAQEERFSRKKFDASFPVRSIDYVLREAGVALSEVDAVAFYEKPFLKFERLLMTALGFAPRGFAQFRHALPMWLKDRLFQRAALGRALRALDPRFDEGRLLFAEHHLSHAASAFYGSPFEEAAVVTLDGVGEWATGSIGVGRGRRLDLLSELRFPHSLGLLYAAFTYYLGFRVNSDEYKVMGLAAYGRPRLAPLIRERLIDVKEDGSFRLDMRYFDYATGLRMTGRRFEQLLGGPRRAPDQPIEQRHMDVAASVQAVTEEVVLAIARGALIKTGMADLCLAGGVALNCVANGMVLRDGRCRGLFIQPAAGDAGGALGAALLAYHGYLDQPRQPRAPDAMQGALLGPAFAQEEIEAALGARGARYRVLDEEALVAATADALAAGKVVGWFQGRMEFGPRALGARSILADPRRPDMQDVLNAKVKLRESFRPFAPAVLREEVGRWFDLDAASPYMLLVAAVRDGKAIPAVTHVDGSARVQTVDGENPLFRRLLRAFAERTGCPILVNTSFNVRDEPLVQSPDDAYRCFMGTEIDALAIGRCFLSKEGAG